ARDGEVICAEQSSEGAAEILQSPFRLRVGLRVTEVVDQYLKKLYAKAPPATLHVVKRIAEGPMDTGPLRAVVRHLRRWAGPADVAPSSDADLLTRFVETRDEVAFAEIVQRHGPLVCAVCRSRLSAADADDAFQATFLVLARRAGSIRKRRSLA